MLSRHPKVKTVHNGTAVQFKSTQTHIRAHKHAHTHLMCLGPTSERPTCRILPSSFRACTVNECIYINACVCVCVCATTTVNSSSSKMGKQEHISRKRKAPEGLLPAGIRAWVLKRRLATTPKHLSLNCDPRPLQHTHTLISCISSAMSTSACNTHNSSSKKYSQSGQQSSDHAIMLASTSRQQVAMQHSLCAGCNV